MKLIKSTIALVTLALWLPTTAHCGLVAAGFLSQPDNCCQKTPAQKSDRKSCDESCDLLLKATLKVQGLKAPVFYGLLSVLPDTSSFDQTRAIFANVCCARESQPPRLSEFAVKTALPIRAP